MKNKASENNNDDGGDDDVVVVVTQKIEMLTPCPKKGITCNIFYAFQLI